MLLKNGANAAAVNPKNWRTAIMLAAEGGHCEVTKLLLSLHEITVHDFGDLGGVSLPEAASESRSAAHPSVLRETGSRMLCNPSARDSEGKTAMLIAAERGHDAIVKLLLKKHVSHTETDLRGNTILHLLARTGNAKLCKAVVDIEVRAYRANQSERRWSKYLKVPNRRRFLLAKNHEGKTAMEVASAYKHSDVDSILRKGAAVYAEYRDTVAVKAERIVDEEEELADRLDYDFAVIPPRTLALGYSPQGYYSMVSDSRDEELGEI